MLFQVQNSIQEDLEKNTTDYIGASVIICEENFCGDFGASEAIAEKTTGKKIGDCLHSCWHRFEHFYHC